MPSCRVLRHPSSPYRAQVHKRRPNCTDYRYGIRMTMSTEDPPGDNGTSTPAPAFRGALKSDIVVVGAGQAGLSSAYHLKERGLAPGRGFVELDRSPRPGG